MKSYPESKLCLAFLFDLYCLYIAYMKFHSASELCAASLLDFYY